MSIIGTSRRHVVLGGVALGLATPACAQPQVRRDLYNGELDYLAKEYAGRADALPASIQLSPASEPGEKMSISGRCLSWQTGKPAAGVIV